MGSMRNGLWDYSLKEISYWLYLLTGMDAVSLDTCFNSDTSCENPTFECVGREEK